MNAETIEEYEKEIAQARLDWPSGPWDNEPNRVEWRSLGFPCLILRSEFGSLCGYVGVPPGHPAHGLKKDEVDVRVHWGLSYGAGCDGNVCHIPDPGEPDNMWWFGFDCAHAFDVIPRFAKVLDWDKLMPKTVRGMDVAYRDIAYVRAGVELLALQLDAMAKTAAAVAAP